MSLGKIFNQANALLDVHGWDFKNNNYIHRDGFKLRFPIIKIPEKGFLSPTSLMSFHNCRRRLYLHKNPTNPYASYFNIFGEKTKIMPFFSLWAVEGNIHHLSLFYITNYILKKVNELKGLGWRTMLAPVIHASILEATSDLNKLDKKNVEIKGELNLDPNIIEKHITRVVDKVWCRRICGNHFERKRWKEQLSKISLQGEVFISRESISGICDALAQVNGEKVIIEYKTGKKAPQLEQSRFNDEETLNILTEKSHEIYPYVFQLVCYCWLLSKQKKHSRAWLVHTAEDPPDVKEFIVGGKTFLEISRIIQTSIEEFDKILDQDEPPKGSFRPEICGDCLYKMNCPDFQEGSINIDYLDWQQRKRGRPFPLLLSVKNIIPEESTIILKKGEEEIKTYVRGVYRKYLYLANDILQDGHDLKVFIRVRGSIYRLTTYEAEFARCT